MPLFAFDADHVDNSHGLAISCITGNAVTSLSGHSASAGVSNGATVLVLYRLLAKACNVARAGARPNTAPVPGRGYVEPQLARTVMRAPTLTVAHGSSSRVLRIEPNFGLLRQIS